MKRNKKNRKVLHTSIKGHNLSKTKFMNPMKNKRNDLGLGM